MASGMFVFPPAWSCPSSKTQSYEHSSRQTKLLGEFLCVHSEISSLSWFLKLWPFLCFATSINQICCWWNNELVDSMLCTGSASGFGVSLCNGSSLALINRWRVEKPEHSQIIHASTPSCILNSLPNVLGTSLPFSIILLHRNSATALPLRMPVQDKLTTLYSALIYCVTW